MRAGGYSSFCDALVEMASSAPGVSPCRSFVDADFTGIVTLSYQGSFSPTTLAHEDAARIFARELIRIYPHAKARIVLFTAQSDASSKESVSLKAAKAGTGGDVSIFISEEERINILQKACDSLQKEFGKDVLFQPGDMEMTPAIKPKGGATIFTIEAYQGGRGTGENKFLIGLGLDNLWQLPHWKRVTEWPGLVDGVLVVDRIETPEIVSDKAKLDVNTRHGIFFPGTTKVFDFQEDVGSWSPGTLTVKLSDLSFRSAFGELVKKVCLLDAALPSVPTGVSATVLRNLIKSGAPYEAVSSMVSKEIYDYIVANRIYSRTKADVAGMAKSWLTGGYRRNRRQSRSKNNRKQKTRNNRRSRNNRKTRNNRRSRNNRN